MKESKRTDEGNIEEDSEYEDLEESPEPESSSVKSKGLINPEDSENVSNSVPSRKRRRVTRACDECRKKKIKCDGKQPCTHCTVYSYDCSYDQPSNRRRNPAPEYVQAIEHRLRRAEALLRTFLPDLALDDRALHKILPSETSVSKETNQVSGETTTSKNEPDLESMVNATGQLEVDEHGLIDYHGRSSSLSFLRQIRQDFGNLRGPEQANFQTTPHDISRKSSQISTGSEKSPDLFRESTTESNVGIDLPSEAIARQLCDYALTEAIAIMPILHQPTFYQNLSRIYSISYDHFQDHDHRFLPLLYNVLALGCLFSRAGQHRSQMKEYVTTTEEGYKYFWAGRQLMDITDCRDILSLQAIVFMVLFLQCSAKLATCYSFIGVALRSALRMGLHRSLNSSFNPIQAEERKRVFFVIRQLDVTVAAILGLPLTLTENDIDQDYPREIKDECITAAGYLSPEEDEVTAMTAANANFRLSEIVSKIVKFIYPVKGPHNEEDKSSKSQNVSYAIIREIENDLQKWLVELPPIFKPSENAPSHILRLRQLLRISYAHTQMMLYRPFLHYLSESNQDLAVDKRAKVCANACISISRNTIHITEEMQKLGLVNGSSWFTIYTTFFAILSLVYFRLENTSHTLTKVAYEDAIRGRQLLASLSKQSMAADRCTETLTDLFQRVSSSSRTEPGPSTMLANDAERVFASPQPPHVSDTTESHPQEIFQYASNPNKLPRQLQELRTEQHNEQRRISTPDRSVLATQSEWSRTPETNQGRMYLSPDPITPSTQARRRSDTAFQQPRVQLGQSTHSTPDMEALMFPTTNPFAYPNQPILTLEGEIENPTTERESLAAGYHNFGQEYHAQTRGFQRSGHMHTQAQDPPMQYPPQMQTNPNSGTWESNAQILPQTTSSSQPVTTSGIGTWAAQVNTQDIPWFNLDQIFGKESWRA